MRTIAKIDFVLLIIVMLLAVFGTAAIYSASSFKAQESYGNSHYFLGKQFFRLCLGILLMMVFLHVDYHWLQQVSPIILLITWLLLLYVLLGGSYFKGSRRSIPILGFVFQPSEMARYALVIFLSMFLVKKGERLKNFNDGLLPALFIVVLMIVPIVLEPDLGTSILTMIVAVIVIFIGGASLYHLASLSVLAITGLGFVISIFPYQKVRLMRFIDAVRGATDPPWQVLQSLISLGNGGLWGVGLGNSRQKLHFLPQPFTDFIFSIVGEEVGLIGCTFLLLLMLAFMWRGLWIAIHAPDRPGMLLAVGITASIVVYAFFNAGIAVNLLPVSGITMPFISYGGSSLIVNFIAIGMLLNISSQARKPKYGGSVAAGKNYFSRSGLKFNHRPKSR
ncbi:MAG: putative lipid II flippase FtsW [candidate division KSB1 bacterium]|nr:putative lipid II flippase FtsW [candidate division KSB1 bacterium]MDZ7319414.1 putative lipid II flippase FtsW [candidate division KSB1 bacterium]MDZ7342827.1 putative lipid II flippase FtsW [candidate division KSB1 bacterium]